MMVKGKGGGGEKVSGAQGGKNVTSPSELRGKSICADNLHESEKRDSDLSREDAGGGEVTQSRR